MVRKVLISLSGIALLTLAVFALLNVEQLEAWGAGLAGHFKGGLPLPLTLLVVFLAGVLTSLTPCVYPVVPLAITYLGARGAASRVRAFSLAAAYVLGMVACYTALGAAAGLTGTTFGAATQKWWVYALVATVVLFFALSMMGLFNLTLPAWVQSLVGKSRRGPGYKGAILMGATSGLVTAPCTAPVLGTLILPMISRQSVFLGSLLLAVFGLGMGMLFLLVGTYSGILSSLPRSGRWMNTVKLVLGVAILFVAAYFYYKAYNLLPLRASSSPAVAAVDSRPGRSDRWDEETARPRSPGTARQRDDDRWSDARRRGPAIRRVSRGREPGQGSQSPGGSRSKPPSNADSTLPRTAPSFEIQDMKGRAHDLGLYRGHTLHLYFFAVWCPPCLDQMRRLEAADARLRGRGYRVLMVAMKEREDVDSLQRFVEKRTLAFPVAWDGQGTVARTFGINSIPAHVLVGPDGTIVYEGRELPDGFEIDGGGFLPR